MQRAPSESLQENWALVTGSSGGIGSAIARELARAGADVVLHGSRPSRGLDSLAEEIAALGRRAEILPQDVSVAGELEAFVAAAWQIAPMDIWVNCAGADVLTGEASSWSFEEKLERLWEVDVRGTVALSRAVGERMVGRGSGVVVNVGWDQAEVGMAGDSGEMFAAIKGAVMAFTRSFAKSVAPDVRVNCVAPGWIKTKWGDDASDYWQERAAKEALLRRWGTPEDVARVVCFLVSAEASFITGQVIPVNGGWAGAAD